MKYRPIVFTAEMAQAIAEGRKTQTRRVIKPQPDEDGLSKLKGTDIWHDTSATEYKCPYGKPGDRLWVREPWKIGAWNENTGEICIDYRDGPDQKWRQCSDPDWFNQCWLDCCDELDALGIKIHADGSYHWEPGKSPLRWRPSIFMPRWASRLKLRITSVSVERLREITEHDAMREGVNAESVSTQPGIYSYRAPFAELWDDINAKRGFGWDANPWVWAVGFEQVHEDYEQGDIDAAFYEVRDFAAKLRHKLVRYTDEKGEQE